MGVASKRPHDSIQGTVLHKVVGIASIVPPAEKTAKFFQSHLNTTSRRTYSCTENYIYFNGLGGRGGFSVMFKIDSSSHLGSSITTLIPILPRR